jgi:hypothetical protein
MSQISPNYLFLKSKLKILLLRFFELPITIYENFRIKRIFKKNREIVIVYTIGKVASTTVQTSLINSNIIDFPVFHLHSLNKSRICEQKDYYKKSKRKSIPLHLIQSSIISDLLDSYSGKIYVLTLTREPIQREVSSIFQDSFNFTSSQNLLESDIEQVISRNLEKMKVSLPEENWFKEEVLNVFGFDLMNIKFDVNKGYLIEVKSNIHIVLIRMENLNEKFSQAAKELFGIEMEICLISDNKSEDKFYNADYKIINANIRIEENLLNTILDSKFINQFYPDFKDTIRKKWLKI